jgi:hypothetical protein
MLFQALFCPDHDYVVAGERDAIAALRLGMRGRDCWRFDGEKGLQIDDGTDILESRLAAP